MPFQCAWWNLKNCITLDCSCHFKSLQWLNLCDPKKTPSFMKWRSAHCIYVLHIVKMRWVKRLKPFSIPSSSSSLSSLPAAQPRPEPGSGREAQRKPVSAGLVPRGHQELPWGEDHQLHHLMEEWAGFLRPAAPLQTWHNVWHTHTLSECFSQY